MIGVVTYGKFKFELDNLKAYKPVTYYIRHNLYFQLNL